MTSGVLIDAICRTAILAAAPTFKVVIPSFFVCVARANRDRSSSMTSVYECQVSKPLEQRSIARTLQMGLSSWRYIEIDFDMSVRQLWRRQQSLQYRMELRADLGDSKLYFSTAIEPQMNVATTEVNDGFSTSGCRHGTCGIVSPSLNQGMKRRTFVLPRLGQLCYFSVCNTGESSIEQ